MTPSFRKEAYRRFWLVKGHLGCHTWQDKEIVAMYDSYFRRLWNNESQCLEEYEEGFEKAYEELIGKHYTT
jgi:hypothetical protein